LPAGELRGLAAGLFNINRGRHNGKPFFDGRPIQGFFNTIDVDRPFQIATVGHNWGIPAIEFAD
jgi:hypothetical protein